MILHTTNYTLPSKIFERSYCNISRQPSSKLVNWMMYCYHRENLEQVIYMNIIFPKGLLNLLTPNSDKHLISLCNITPESNITVTRIKKMVTS